MAVRATKHATPRGGLPSPKHVKPGQVGVKQIPVSQLAANPHNPRYLFDEEPLKELRDSIARVGVLVPLTVYWSARSKRWVILDGQRRWMCAQELGQSTVPCNQVAEPSLVENIVTMFQIHKLREDWQLMPTALKLELLIKETGEHRDRHLAVLTGLDVAVVVRCKKLLTFSRRHQDMMLTPSPGDRIKADFFIELYAVLSDRAVRKMPWFRREDFTDRMLEKYKAKAGLRSVTDFRTIKQHVNNAVKAKREKLITKRLKEFSERDDLGLSHLLLPEAASTAEARAVAKLATSLSSKLETLETERVYGEAALWKELQGLLVLIRKTLIAAGFRVQ